MKLHDAISNNNIAECEEIIKEFGINLYGNYHKANLGSFSPFEHAILIKRIEIVKLFEKYDLTKTFLQKITHNVETDNVFGAKALLDYGADPNTINESNKPLLEIAINNRNENMVKILLQHGANPNIKMDLFSAKGYIEEISLLNTAIINDSEESIIKHLLDKNAHSLMLMDLSIRSDERIENVITKRYKSEKLLNECAKKQISEMILFICCASNYDETSLFSRWYLPIDMLGEIFKIFKKHLSNGVILVY